MYAVVTLDSYYCYGVYGDTIAIIKTSFREFAFLFAKYSNKKRFEYTLSSLMFRKSNEERDERRPLEFPVRS